MLSVLTGINDITIDEIIIENTTLKNKVIELEDKKENILNRS